MSFEEFYCERNVKIYIQNIDNKEKQIIPNLSTLSCCHISDKSVSSVMALSITDESLSKTNNENENEHKNNDNYYFKK